MMLKHLRLSKFFLLCVIFCGCRIFSASTFLYSAEHFSDSASVSKHRLVLSLAAHPDDEDGGTLALMRQDSLTETATLFFTNGEGGQNEIGGALQDELAAIRQKETRAAAKILGSTPYFLSFPDFGYSKTASETFEKWGGKEAVLAKLVYFIRKLQPDVIITNHDTVTTGERRQHGQHQVVGLCAYDAFQKAADSNYQPEQFWGERLPAWQIKRLFYRTFQNEVVSETSLVQLNMHARDCLGNSAQDVAIQALAEHRSQGMDKVTPETAPWLFNQRHRYQLMKHAKGFALRNDTSLLSGIPPSEKPALLPEQETADADLAPFRLQVFPKFAPLRFATLSESQQLEPATYALLFRVNMLNRYEKILPVMLSVEQSGEVIFRKPYVFSGENKRLISDTILVKIKKPYESEGVSLTVKARPAGGFAKENGLSPQVETVELKPIAVHVPQNVKIGLVQTYDYTLPDFLNSFQINYALLDSAALASKKLHKYSTILLDLRAYAYRSDLVKLNENLLEYVKNGGNVVCFYHKTFDWNGHDFAPYPLMLSRKRVTEESAPVKMLLPNHPLLNEPNKIEPIDWWGWVQERNLYLPENDTAQTSAKYQRLLQMSDTGENAPPTSLLWAKYGKGTYTYTSLALYRQLRQFHTGALKLFFNLIAQPAH
ncbi:LmbE family protein [Chloroherpeton thalassium ATCC 35110]|uniref:LmbE family protein n=1 Tax=Chloroherpeton thalassium (strain ATCC 35110 / GB-78) TaxID=517418 RepID=B3QYT7_CHLT3|nr:PIG-L family deacetylase [Chloroherpeton thalassium]ACF15160.1 LmbE family protein [Chloroherpeton thalassium ATCC 35110]